MKIIFTGASSFTGSFFVKMLANSGHSVTACLHFPLSSYTGLRKQRLDHIQEHCKLVFDCPFGSPAFMDVIAKGERWDLLCHHGADVGDYKSPDFNVSAALASNTLNLKEVLQALLEKKICKVILTGSVFEQNEGTGTDNLRAVSPYGLSKGLTTEVFRFYTAALGVKLGKFVIPNPFGPYENDRFTSYAARTWLEGKPAIVNTPDYVRDNIPVTLLAKAYSFFAERLNCQPGFERFNPSFYAETQSDFTARFAREIGKRLNLPCDFEIKKQPEFVEPRVRINFDVLNPFQLHWNEADAWDELAKYYEKTFGKRA